MGTTVSNLQILGAAESAVKAALPKALVGQWSERFVTACPDDLSFSQLDRKAGWLSRKLDCTVLSVSMFDGDALSLTLYVSGKRIARHLVCDEEEKHVPGNTAAFCEGLGLPPKLAPLLKRLFAERDQEEKLEILSCLLGAPLFVREDSDPERVEFQPTDDKPLYAWIEAHPLPPKLKNQTGMELLQEIGERGQGLGCGSGAMILRPMGYLTLETVGPSGQSCVTSPCGVACSGGEWAHWSQDGHLLLTPLQEEGLCDLCYVADDGRLLTITEERKKDEGGGHAPKTARIVSDSAGILPLPLPLIPEGQPMGLGWGYLLPDGGFLADLYPQNDKSREMLCRYSAKGDLLWSWKGEITCITVIGERIYLSTGCNEKAVLHCLTLEGEHLRSAATGSNAPIHIDGTFLYQLKEGCYLQDDTLLRFTPDLRDAGEIPVPYMSQLAIAPDGSFLVCAGFGSGLMVIGAGDFSLRAELRNHEDYCLSVVDGKNRIWAANGSCLECWSADLKPLSRHRFAGDIMGYTLNQAGEVCIATFQDSKYRTRVYRFYGKKNPAEPRGYQST